MTDAAAFELYGPARDTRSRYTLRVALNYVQAAIKWANKVRIDKGEQPLKLTDLFISDEIELRGNRVRVGSYQGGDPGLTGRMDGRVLADLDYEFSRAASEILDHGAKGGPAVFIPALREAMEARRDYIASAKLTSSPI